MKSYVNIYIYWLAYFTSAFISNNNEKESQSCHIANIAIPKSVEH